MTLYFYRPIYCFVQTPTAIITDIKPETRIPDIVHRVSRTGPETVRVGFKLRLQDPKIEDAVRFAITARQLGSGDLVDPTKAAAHRIYPWPTESVVLRLQNDGTGEFLGQGEIKTLAGASASGIPIYVDMTRTAWDTFLNHHASGSISAHIVTLFLNEQGSVGGQVRSDFNVALREKIGSAYAAQQLDESGYLMHDDAESIAREVAVGIQYQIGTNDRTLLPDLYGFARESVLKRLFTENPISKWDQLQTDPKIQEKMHMFLEPKLRKVVDDLENDENFKNSIDSEKLTVTKVEGSTGFKIPFLADAKAEASRDSSDKLVRKLENEAKVKFKKSITGEYYIVDSAHVLRLRENWKQITQSETTVVSVSGTPEQGVQTEAGFPTLFTESEYRKALAESAKQADSYFAQLFQRDNNIAESSRSIEKLKIELEAEKQSVARLGRLLDEKIREAEDKARGDAVRNARIAAANANGNFFRIVQPGVGYDKIWWVENGLRRWVVDHYTLTKLGLTGTNDGRIAKNEFGHLLPEGPEISIKPPPRNDVDIDRPRFGGRN